MHQKEEFTWHVQNYKILVFYFVVSTPGSLFKNWDGLFIYLFGKTFWDLGGTLGIWSTSAFYSFPKVQCFSSIVNHLIQHWHFSLPPFFLKLRIKCWTHRIEFCSVSIWFFIFSNFKELAFISRFWNKRQKYFCSKMIECYTVSSSFLLSFSLWKTSLQTNCTSHPFKWHINISFPEMKQYFCNTKAHIMGENAMQSFLKSSA